jgi:GH43 family beta-xylosidase
MKLSDIHIRDPFILLENGKYYLYGTRFDGEVGTFPQKAEGTDVYVSDDLVSFSGPIPVFRRDKDFWGTHHFWAPEVHKYKNKYYCYKKIIKIFIIPIAHN